MEVYTRNVLYSTGTSTKCGDGCSFEELRNQFGDELGNAATIACTKAAEELPQDWIHYDEARALLRLKGPEGFLFSNDAIATVFARLDEQLGHD